MSDDSSKRQQYWPVEWWQALAFCVSTYLFIIFLTSLISSFVYTNSTTMRGLLYLFSSGIILTMTWIYLKKSKVNIRNLFGDFLFRQVALVPLYYIGYVVLSRFVQLLVDPIPGVDLDQRQDFGVQPQSLIQLVIIFLSLVVLPAIAEEVMFRGLLYRSFKKKFGVILSTVVVGSLFGLAHGQLNVAIDTFVLSLVLVLLIEKSSSLWPAISLHLLKNVVAFLVVFVFNGS